MILSSNSGNTHSIPRYEQWQFSRDGSRCVARRLRLTRNLQVEWFRHIHPASGDCGPRYVNQFHVIRDVRAK